MACAALSIAEEVVRRRRGREQLEAEITELWGYLNVATYRFLTLVAEFDREEGYAYHGLANTAQWLNWQCGIGPVAAREKVRVARALEQLPEIADAFAKGEISYSKVRAMTRVATAANESVLVSVARHGTAAHVEKLVRKYCWTQRRDAAALSQRQHEFRNVWCFFDMDGEFVLHARLPREVGAVVRRALDVAVEAVKNASAETPLQIPANTWHRFQLLVEQTSLVFIVLTRQRAVESAQVRITLNNRWTLQAQRRSRRELAAELQARVILRRSAGGEMKKPSLKLVRTA